MPVNQEKVVVIDFGGGTLDISLIECFSNEKGNRKNGIKTILLALLVMALWGSLFPFIKIGYNAFGETTVYSYYYLDEINAMTLAGGDGSGRVQR